MNTCKNFFILLLVFSLASCHVNDMSNTYTIKGKVGWDEFLNPGLVNFPVVLLSGDQIIATTTSQDFTFSGLEEGQSYTVRPQSLDFSRNGLSTLDWVQVEHFINGDTKFSPFQVLASDMNLDNVVDESDRYAMRTCIIGNGQCPSWRFASSDYDGHGKGYVDEFTVTKIASDLEVNFIPIKIGDVNNTIKAN